MEKSAVRPHVPDDELHAYCDGELSPPQRVEIAEHLLGCLICRAAHAEVEELRTRTSALLAIASPRVIRRPAMPATRQVVAHGRLQLRGMAAAAVLAVVGAGGWFALRTLPNAAPSQLATLVSPALLAGNHRVMVTAARSSELQFASLGANHVVTAVMPRSDVTDRDPALVTGWMHQDWDEALTAANGSLARIPGVLITAVRSNNAASARPTFVVRQELADGRPVWVFDATTDNAAAVNQSLQAAGVASSASAQTRSDYQTLDAQGARPARTIVVAGFLPVDSLNALARQLTLR